METEKLFKCYILLFTCATTRAIHLELTPDMSTSAVIRAIQRFINRKDYPRRFISDNFKSFKSSELKNFLRKHLEWRFLYFGAIPVVGWIFQYPKSIKL